MKLIGLFLFIALQASALVKAQQISLNVNKTSIDKVLRIIKQQTGYDYSIRSSDIKYGKPITLTLKSSPIEEALLIIFKDQPYNYRVKNKVIMIQLKETEPPAASPTVKEKDGPVTGQVTDKDGNPLSGATVSVKDGSLGAVTDANGRFVIPNAPANGTLIITMIGRESRQVTYKSSLVSPIVLLEVNEALKEVQIIAYGEVEKRFSTSNIGSINAATIARQPVANPLLALAGRTPGLFIQSTSGLSTGAINVTVQGKNSLKNGNIPFYVIDGVPFTPNAFTSNVMGNIGAGATSNLNFVNPSDIESIEILKDADATAIYGSRAANGAILITTKKGKAGSTKVDLNLQTGWGKIARNLDLLNTEDYIAMRLENYKNGNSAPTPADYDVNGVWDMTRYTDWQKELLGGTSQYQNLQASVSGGSDRTQFLAGAGYIRETTVFDGDFSNVKTNVHFNVNHSSINQKFRFFLSGNYLQGNNRLPQTDLTSDATYLLPPNAPALYNADGTLNWAPNPNNPNDYTLDNPMAKLLQRYSDKTGNLIGSSLVSYQLIPGLTLKSSFGFNRLESDELSYSPFNSITPAAGVRNRRARYGDKSIQTWIIEPQITFNKAYSFGNIDALIGSTFQTTNNSLLALEGTGFTNDAQLPNINAAGTKTVLSSTFQSQYNYNAVFGRLNYRYMERYIINLAARRDGSSRFGSENLFHNFYSIGGAWLFSEETFVKRVLPLISFGKLRGSYGTSGNDQINDYRFYSLYNNIGVTNPFQSIVGVLPNGLPNPYLQWEETRKLNVGIDIGVFQSRLMVTANFFRNRSSNQLLDENLSVVTGFQSITRNLPAIVQNTGWEFQMDYTPIRTSEFTWQGSANLTIPKNKLIRYDGLAESGDRNNYIIGESINIRKVFIYAGVNPETGLYQFVDSKGALTSAPIATEDRTGIVNLEPTLYGGISNTLSYKGFEFDIFFQFVKQRMSSNRFGNYPGFSPGQQPVILNERWQKLGDIADVQKVSSNFSEINGPLSAANNSDEFYSNAAYLRLKNASISYTFDNKLLQRVHITNARFYVQGQNLLTFTKYFGGGDPEIASGNRLGMLRTISVGTQLTF